MKTRHVAAPSAGEAVVAAAGVDFAGPVAAGPGAAAGAWAAVVEGAGAAFFPAAGMRAGMSSSLSARHQRQQAHMLNITSCALLSPASATYAYRRGPLASMSPLLRLPLGQVWSPQMQMQRHQHWRLEQVASWVQRWMLTRGLGLAWMPPVARHWSWIPDQACHHRRRCCLRGGSGGGRGGIGHTAGTIRTTHN